MRSTRAHAVAPTARAAPCVLLALLALLGLTACQTSFEGSWETLGPTDGSIVLAMVDDPAIPQLLYASTSAGQVYRTRVEAHTSVGGRGLPSDAAVSALVADPRHSGALYAGTSNGLYFTSDNGDTWQAQGRGLPHDALNALALAPAAPGATVWAGTQQHGVYVSHDAGLTWSAANAGLPAGAGIYGLTYDGPSSTLYAGLIASGVYSSTDGGQTWTKRSAGLPSQSDTFVVLPMHGPKDTTLYAGTSKGLYASADGGAMWHGTGLTGARVLALAADAGGAGMLYAGTDTNVIQSADAGQHWQPVAPGVTRPVAAILVLKDKQGHTVVFVGAGEILRYPSLPTAAPNNPSGAILTVIVLLVLLGVLYYVNRRHMSYLRSTMARGAGSPGAPPPNGADTPQR